MTIAFSYTKYSKKQKTTTKPYPTNWGLAKWMKLRHNVLSCTKFQSNSLVCGSFLIVCLKKSLPPPLVI